MENDRVLTGSANLDAIPALRSRPSQRGHDAVTAASGGFEVLRGTDYESRPLLARDEDDSGSRPEILSGDGQRGGVEWEGENDFESRPWWNKPSVNEIFHRSLAQDYY